MGQRVPRYVFWRRRLLALAGAIAVVWVVVQLVGVFSGGDGDKPPAAAPTASGKSSAPSPTQSPTPSSTPPGSGQAVPVALPTSAKPCNPEDVDMLAWVPSGQFAGGPVDLNLVFSTTTKGGCTLTADAAQLVVVISSGGTPVYDSSVCKTSRLTTPVSLPQGWATQTTVSWSGRGSGRDCSPTRAYASPGSYELQIGTLGGNPAQTRFILARLATTPSAPAPSAPAPSAATPSATRPTPSATTPSATAKTD